MKTRTVNIARESFPERRSSQVGDCKMAENGLTSSAVVFVPAVLQANNWLTLPLLLY
jgi:hypothetical protein